MITLIAVLVSLLVPAVSFVRHSVKVTEVRTEISQIEAAADEFLMEYGTPPPSQIHMYEHFGSLTDPNPGWYDSPKYRSVIKSIWPKFDFQKPRDFNNDGDYDDWFIIKGDQAMVLFLGGMYDPSRGLLGFSHNPTDPFDTSSSTRVGPFFKFDQRRIRTQIGIPYPYYDSSSTLTGDSLPLFPVYVDPISGQTRPYIFISSQDSLTYNDGPGFSSDANTFPTSAERPQGFRAYRKQPDQFWKPRSMQIISPGYDGAYGEGGIYDPEAQVQLPIGSSGVVRTMEEDNITNFMKGELVP